ncbi:uncharacterized protein LOC118189917 isoform X2 [Stegodyphus dumicola]|uniref:uncharacterized protein LOC118189917 isoform X2 n=1 Tax=Stegodyphus dumicola TaxID=202533 RepID=UPI0015A7E1A5|nr:uncharacterized protein LOC118189917 isoform X2 [Stegodyphus dumicola]
MVQMIPYILPLLLGRTFDLDKMQVGVDIFPKEVISKPVLIQKPITETHYKIIDNSVEARDLLDVEGSFSLKVKAGVCKAGASGAYLADTYNRENTVDVAIKASYEVVTEQLPANAKPFDTWKSLGGALGTHFVRSITYGGELLASVRMECNSTRDKQRIKGAFDIGGKLEIFDIGVEAEGEYLKEVSKSVEKTQIKVFSSIPLSQAPNDMKSLKAALNNFPEDLKKFNGGNGIPLKIELWPLDFLDSTRPAYIKNRALEANLDFFEQKFDDLLNTKQAISEWMKVMTQPLSEEQEKKIGNFYSEIQKTIQPFYKVIGDLDMSKGSEQLKPANDAYGSGVPGMYYKKYLLLRQAVAKDQGEWTRNRGRGATYIHWGKQNCIEVADKMSDGIVVGPQKNGGGSNFICLSKLPKTGTSSPDQNNAAILQNTSFEFPKEQRSRFYCSTCRLGARGTVQTFVGTSVCPNDWELIYEGILMSGSQDSISTIFICLDKDPVIDRDTTSSSPLVPDWATSTDDQAKKKLLFSCVVCTK